MVLISRGTPILTKIYGRYSIGRAVLLVPHTCRSTTALAVGSIVYFSLGIQDQFPISFDLLKTFVVINKKKDRLNASKF